MLLQYIVDEKLEVLIMEKVNITNRPRFFTGREANIH